MQSLFPVCGLLLLIISVHAHVVKHFTKECKHFFYKNFVPRGLNSSTDVHICQSFQYKYYFATIYDPLRRIPVYSAYVFENKKGCGRSKEWFVEPQLVNYSWGKNMMTGEALKSKYDASTDLIGQKQAVNEDYIGLLISRGYNRGHLNPSGHHADDGCNATFTLTNVVPQNAKLNSGAWAQYENKLKNKIFKSCNKAFVLVGAIPSANNWVKKRVNIPDYLWHAYCCVDNSYKPIKSGAATAKNAVNKVQEGSLDDLKQFFKKLNKKVPELFYNNCKAKSSVVF